MKNSSFFTLLITFSLLQAFSAAGATEQAVYEQTYSSLMGLMDPVVNKKDFFQEGFTQASQDKWNKALKNLEAYYKQTKFTFSVSQANLRLFRESIQELMSSTADLFDTVNYFTTKKLFNFSNYFAAMQEDGFTQSLTTRMNKLRAHISTISQFVNKLAPTGDELATAKSLKEMLAKIFDAWSDLYTKAYENLATIEANQDQKTQNKLEEVKKRLKPITVTHQMIAYAESNINSQPEQAAVALDNLQQNISNQLKNTNLTTINDYLTVLKELLAVKSLYAKLPKNIQREETAQNIDKNIGKNIGVILSRI